MFTNVQLICKSRQIKRTKQNQVNMPRQSTLLCLQQLSQVSNTSRLNSNQLKNALNRLEALFGQRRQVLVRASLLEILQQLKTVLQMELLAQQQQEQLLVQLQRHLADDNNNNNKFLLFPFRHGIIQ